MHPEISYLIRILVAGALAALLGFEREQAHKPAGLRTHILVGIAAAMYTSLAELTALAYEGRPADPIRAIQAVALGVGFLGGGMIVTGRGRGGVQGLTTAASIWATAAVGLAAGFGHYVLALGVTVLLLIVLRVLIWLERPEPPAE